jgi:hypothetical protein
MIKALVNGKESRRMNMLNYMNRHRVVAEINKWLKGEITSAQLAIWARESRERWENDELELEDEDCLLDSLYKLTFTDWMDSVPKEYLSNEADCSLSKEEALELIKALEKPDTL